MFCPAATERGADDDLGCLNISRPASLSASPGTRCSLPFLLVSVVSAPPTLQHHH